MKKALALLALPALLAGCFAGEPAAPAPATGQIDGAVVDHLLRPFSDHTVTLVQLERTDQTSLLGGFTFREVPPGFYTVTTSLDGVTATQVVDVEADKITRVILQLLPAPTELLTFDAYPFTSLGERAEAGQSCESCEWAIPLASDRRPEEVTLEAVWEPNILPGQDSDHLDITITDGRGFPLYSQKGVSSPAYISIDGLDIHPEATEIRVQVFFSNGFLPGAQEFVMHSVMTHYHGATKEQMFGSAA